MIPEAYMGMILSSNPLKRCSISGISTLSSRFRGMSFAPQRTSLTQGSLDVLAITAGRIRYPMDSPTSARAQNSLYEDLSHAAEASSANLAPIGLFTRYATSISARSLITFGRSTQPSVARQKWALLIRDARGKNPPTTSLSE